MILHGFPTFDLAYLLIHDGGQGGHAWGNLKKKMLNGETNNPRSYLLNGIYTVFGFLFN
jgi:hypothetical protein